MNDYYKNLIQREQDLLGNVEIISDVVYWPVSVTEVKAEQLEPLHRRILGFIKNGYNERKALRKRLQTSEGFDEQLDWLIEHDWLAQQNIGDRETFTVNERPAEPDLLKAVKISSVHDAVNGTILTFPDTTSFLRNENLSATVPILANAEFAQDTPTIRYVECLLMLILSRRTKVRTARVFHQSQEAQCLQGMLYDFVLDSSDRITHTNLVNQETIVAPRVDHLIAIAEPILPAQVDENLELTPPKKAHTNIKLHVELKTDAPIPHAITPRIEIISGRAQHEQVLEEALRQARQQVIVVTPFIRARLTDYSFRMQLMTALQRGVDITVIHGMPNRTEDFDDTPHENRRISDLIHHLGRCRSHLKFIRVTGEGSSAAGEHSKILVCDQAWAIVTSFNWLSFQETNETGVRFEDAASVNNLLQLFDGYMGQATSESENCQEVQAAWPTRKMTTREINEWNNGEYNSQ